MEGMFEKLQETVAFVKARTSLQPTVGIILGSGLGKLVDQITDQLAIDYQDLPHLLPSPPPAPSVW